jgi:hypothetical protein
VSIDPAQNGSQGPMQQADPSVGVNQALHAIEVLAGKAAGAQSAAEAKDFGAASLAFAQMIVLLDPSRDATGVPLEHQVALEQQRQDGAARLERAKAQAAAPTPARRRLSVSRDEHGRASSYQVDG